MIIKGYHVTLMNIKPNQLWFDEHIVEYVFCNDEVGYGGQIEHSTT